MPYLTLFFSALIAATLFPLGSEVMLLGLLTEQYPWALLLLVATLGNTLGSVVNYLLGWQLPRFQHRRWFPFSEVQWLRAKNWFDRFGSWVLLGCWLPIVGDPLTLYAGMMRMSVWRFLLLVTLAKGGRYAVLVAVWWQAQS